MIELKVREYESDDAITRLADVMEELNDVDCSSRTRFLIAEARQQRQEMIEEIVGLESSFEHFMEDIEQELKEIYNELGEGYFLKDTEVKRENFVDKMCKRLKEVCKNINNIQYDKQKGWQEKEWKRGY